MALTKRTRFEILRRDNHACRYCGAAAPDARLTVDHVVPKALGGTDDHTNLVTACADCNAGKASTRPDDATVADVREDALRHAELTRQAYAVLVEQMGNRDDYINAVAEAFPGQPAPADWRDTIGRWFQMGVPLEIVVDAARTAARKTTTSRGGFTGVGRFNYLCGIVWNQVHLVDEQVARRAALDGSWMTEEEVAEIEASQWSHGYLGGKRTAERAHTLDNVLADFIDRGKLEPRPDVLALLTPREVA